MAWQRAVAPSVVGVGAVLIPISVWAPGLTLPGAMQTVPEFTVYPAELEPVTAYTSLKAFG